jgi:hypothetical protein
MVARAARFVILAGLFLVAVPAIAAAQDATPPAGPEVPAPEECVVEPRTPEELEAIASGSSSGFATPPLTDVPFGAPDGEPADAETAAAFTAVVRESWACLNAGDWPRFFALLTEDEMRQGFGADIVALGSSPAAPYPPDQQTAVYAILDIEVLPDGRVGGFVVVDTSGDPLPVEINYQIAAETEDGWRIDDFVCFSASGGLC